MRVRRVRILRDPPNWMLTEMCQPIRHRAYDPAWKNVGQERATSYVQILENLKRENFVEPGAQASVLGPKVGGSQSPLERTRLEERNMDLRRNVDPVR